MCQVLFWALGNIINETDRKACPQGDYIQLPDHESQRALLGTHCITWAKIVSTNLKQRQEEKRQNS